MFKKFSSYLIPISILLLLCFYATYKISYKTFSNNPSNTNSNNNTTEILINSKEKHISVGSTTDKNNKVKDTKKEAISNEEKKQLATEKQKKENSTPEKAKEKTHYEYKDFFERLKELGFYKAEFKDENINFRNAVLRFQSSQNISVDGIIGPETTNLLMKEKKQTTDTLPKDFLSGYCIIINKDTRILTVYYNKSIHKKYPIAVGRDPSFTPSGKFTLATKLVDPAWYNSKTGNTISGGIAQNPLGKRWLGLSFKGGSTYGIHGNNNPWSIGTNASLGCIRMINTDVEELFDYIPMDSPIWIGDSKLLNSWGVIQK